MKNCPFCDEEIRDAAIKCKHCGSMLAAPPGDTATPDGAVPPGGSILPGSGGPPTPTPYYGPPGHNDLLGFYIFTF